MNPNPISLHCAFFEIILMNRKIEAFWTLERGRDGGREKGRQMERPWQIYSIDLNKDILI